MVTDEIELFFSGETLYGDDFTLDQLHQWYEKEKEGYGDLVRRRPNDYRYEYKALNQRHGFRHIHLPPNCKAMAIGGAFCEELQPVADQLSHIANLDPSTYFDVEQLSGVPIEHIKPATSGEMPFSDNELDLITCFGVMHHIANVSFVVRECYRVLSPGGIMLLREPIVSMGDWRKPRSGLTANERGIPAQMLERITLSSGFVVKNKALCDFSPLVHLGARLGFPVYSSSLGVFLDHYLSNLFSINVRYHRTSLFHKFAPASLALVLKKPKK